MAPTTLHLRVIWTEAHPGASPVAATQLQEHGLSAANAASREFGMQKGHDEVIPGESLRDGATLFVTSIEPYIDKAGRHASAAH